MIVKLEKDNNCQKKYVGLYKNRLKTSLNNSLTIKEKRKLHN